MKKTVMVLALLFSFAFVFSVATTFISNVNVQTVSAAVLKYGSRGQDVKTLQTRLKKWGYYTGSIDGVFGNKTREAVKYFQRRNKLTVDGIVGEKTASAIGMKLSSSSSSSSQGTGGYTSADINLLARVVYGEARGESYVGQVAVAAVVLNRIESSSFPNTMAGVVYQRHAFTAVSDGQINLTPNDTAKRAAMDAINGWDPSYNALYYYNPKIATSSWIFSRPTTVVIGNHVFAR